MAKSNKKGEFEVDKKVGKQIAVHKSSSMRIVALAAQEYIINGTPVEDTIVNHKNIYDFCFLYEIKKIRNQR
jgi:hypothetical protein